MEKTLSNNVLVIICTMYFCVQAFSEKIKKRHNKLYTIRMDDRGDRKMKKDLLVFLSCRLERKWWRTTLVGISSPNSDVELTVERWLCGVHLPSSLNFWQNFWNLSHETVPLYVKRWLLCAGYFSGALGPGQLGMFNLLKAYSILDHEVGYCQVRPISTVHYHTLHVRLGRYTTRQSDSWFCPVNNVERSTRSTADPLNLRAQAARLEVRKNFFSNRVVEDWNKIPASLKKAKTVKSFKNGYAHLRANMVESTWYGSGRNKMECVDHTFSPILAKRP